MKKHKFNILPLMSGDEYNKLCADIEQFGYDKRFPIITFDGDILDGWNRWQASQYVGAEPTFETFEGSPSDAINYVARANNRRTLSREDWKLFWGRLYNLEKENVGGQSGNDNALKNESAIVADSFKEPTPTSVKIAEQAGASPRSIENYGKLAEEIDEHPELEQDFREKKITQKEILEKLKPEQDKTDTIDNTRFDGFTNNAKHHGIQIETAIRNLTNAINAAYTYFKAEETDFKIFGNRLALINLDKAKLNSQSLKSLELCPYCKGEKCTRCEQQGYVLGTVAKSMRFDIKRSSEVESV